MPGRVHTLRMQADEPGIYAGQCTEFCGLSHANMRMEAVALNRRRLRRPGTANQLEPYVAPEAGSQAAARRGDVHRQLRLLPPGQRPQLDGADGTVTPVLANPDQYVCSGAAPNLTHLMTRNTFAGATWDLLTDECRDRRVERLARGVRRALPRRASPTSASTRSTCVSGSATHRPRSRCTPSDAQKANSGGKVRGMPNLGLTEDPDRPDHRLPPRAELTGAPQMAIIERPSTPALAGAGAPAVVTPSPGVRRPHAPGRPPPAGARGSSPSTTRSSASCTASSRCSSSSSAASRRC